MKYVSVLFFLEFDTLLKFSSMYRICLKYQSLFSRKIRETITSLSSAEFFQKRVNYEYYNTVLPSFFDGVKILK